MQLEFDFIFGNSVKMTEAELARVSGAWGSLRDGSQYHVVRRFMRRNNLESIFMLGRDSIYYKWFLNPKSRTGISRYRVDRLCNFRT